MTFVIEQDMCDKLYIYMGLNEIKEIIYIYNICVRASLVAQQQRICLQCRSGRSCGFDP